MREFYFLRLITICIFFISAVQQTIAQTHTPRNISMTANSDGYYEYLPQGYNSGSQNYPLIIFVHGAGELGNVPLSALLGAGLPAVINQGEFPPSFTVNGQTSSFIVISPHFNPNWPVPNDIQEIINYVIQHYRVDQSRIYMTGLSMGGGATWDYGGGSSVYANRLAAIVPVAGASWPEFSRGRVIANANLPVWATHNNGDQVVPVSNTNNYIANINSAPAPNPLAKKTLFFNSMPPDNHDAWTQTYDPDFDDGVHGGPNIYEWMLQYNRNFSGNPPPTVNVGPPQTISLPTNQVSLTGTGIAGTGTSITSHVWTKFSGGSATITDPSNYNTTVTGLSAGTYSFHLTVTQDDGQSATGNVMVIVNATPPPTANAGPPQTITLPTNTATMAGSGTANNGGSITAHTWTKFSGGTATITDPSNYGTTITGLSVGTYMFRLTVTQNNNQTATSDVMITVNPQPKNIPGKIEAENWNTKSGPQYAVPTSDAGGGQHVIGISNGSWMDYNVTVTQSGTYTVNFRVATTQNNVQFQLKSGNTVLGSTNISNTGGWDVWATVPLTNISLTAGVQTIRVLSTSNSSCNFNWMDWVLTTSATAPVANAGPPQTIVSPPATQVTFSGSGTANNGGSIISHIWTKFSGGSATITDPSNYGTTVTGLAVGTYTFRLTVTQNDNQTATSDVTITVNPAPLPTANAGPPQTIVLPANQVTLAGSGTANNGGSIIAHTWTKFSGGAATITDPSSYNSTVTGLSAGTYIFRLTVTQNDNQTASSNVTITVNNPGPPTANAGASQTIALPANQVTLTGNGTSGSGGPITYAWTQLSGTAASIASPSAVSTNITGLTTAGVRVFRLTVTQSDNQAATSDVTVTVNPAGGNGKFIGGKIEAEAWDTKSGGMYAVATNDAGGGQHVVGIANGNWMDYNVTVTQSGIYTINFRVATPQNNVQFQVKSGNTVLGTTNITSTGGWDVWATVPLTNITLTAGAQTIRIQSASTASCNFNWMDWILSATSTSPSANAGPAQTITLPANTVTLAGSGTANNAGSIISHTWTKFSGGSAAITDPSDYGTTVTGLSVGTYIFRLTVTQNDNQTATADVTITVNSAPAPTANAGSPQTITLPANQVTLSGSGTANNTGGSIISHVWTKLSGGSATITDANNYGTTVTGLSAGSYTFRLTVTQNDNQTATSDVTTTVNPAGGNGKFIAGKIEAENWDTKSGGMYPVSTTDAGGGQQVIGISNGSWMDYHVTVTQTGNYTVGFRVATTHNNAQFQLKLGATVLATLNIPNTGGWNTWVTAILNNVSLAAGVQTLRIQSITNETCNFNWMDYALVTPTITRTAIIEEKPLIADIALSAPLLKIFPNPVTDQFVLQTNSEYEGIMKIQVLDQAGNSIRQVQAVKTKGTSRVNMSAAGISAGIYIIRVQTGSRVGTVKMVRQ